MTIRSRAEKVKSDCEEVGTQTSVLGATSYASAGRVLITSGRPFLTYFVADNETAIESGYVVKIGVPGTHLLVGEKSPDVWKDEAFEYKMTGFLCNVVLDVLRQRENRDSYTYQTTYGWNVIASGVRGFRTDLGGEQIFLGSGLPVALDSEEFLLPAWSMAYVDDRLQVAAWTSGAGTVSISELAMTGIGTSFETDLYEGGRIEITDGDGEVSFVYIDSIESDIGATLVVSGGEVVNASYRFLTYSEERYRVSSLRDNKFAGVLVCGTGEDTR